VKIGSRAAGEGVSLGPLAGGLDALARPASWSVRLRHTLVIQQRISRKADPRPLCTCDFPPVEDKDHARKAAKAFQDAYGAKFPKATAKITDDLQELLAFYDFPAEHWVHLRTTNPIESTFATVRHRTRVTKGPGSKAAGIAMAFKLIEAAQHRWRAVNAPHLVALVRAGAKFERGKLTERQTPRTPDEATKAA